MDTELDEGVHFQLRLLKGLLGVKLFDEFKPNFNCEKIS